MFSVHRKQRKAFRNKKHATVCLHVCVCACTFILEEIAAVRRLARERRGHKLSQHGEIGGAVGTGCQGVEGVVAGPPHGALVWR